MEAESSLRNVVLNKKDRTMDKDKAVNTCGKLMTDHLTMQMKKGHNFCLCQII
jgi:hypothetical protein